MRAYGAWIEFRCNSRNKRYNYAVSSFWKYVYIIMTNVAYRFWYSIYIRINILVVYRYVSLFISMRFFIPLIYVLCTLQNNVICLKQPWCGWNWVDVILSCSLNRDTLYAYWYCTRVYGNVSLFIFRQIIFYNASVLLLVYLISIYIWEIYSTRERNKTCNWYIS